MGGAKLTQPGPCLKDLPPGGRRDTPVGSSHQQGTVADAVGTEARGKETSHQEPGRVQKRELRRKERKWWGEDSVFGISRRKLVYIGWIKKWSYSIAQGAVFNTL